MIKYLLIAVTMFIASYAHADNLTQEDINCLRMNTYHEARGEGYQGQIAVVHVVLNRVNSDRYPNSVCEVVHQGRFDKNGNPIRHQCQFSWYCDGRSDRVHNQDAWDEISLAVQEAVYLYNRDHDITNGAMYYHTINVNPSWSRQFERVSQIGVHIFYVRG